MRLRVDWLRRRGRSPEPGAGARTDGTAGPVVESAAPGVAVLLGEAGKERGHSVLDLGSAADTSLRVYSRFARRMRFVDLLAGVASGQGWTTALPAQPEQPYDLVFAWDILDRLLPEERPHLVERLVEVTARRARLHFVVDASGEASTRPLRFALLDVDRLAYEAAGPMRPARRRLLPAEVERLLLPFRVIRAFTLKAGFREYVAVREDG